MIYHLGNLVTLAAWILAFVIVLVILLSVTLYKLGTIRDQLQGILTQIGGPTLPPYVSPQSSNQQPTEPSTARALGPKFARSTTKSSEQQPTVCGDAILNAVVEADVEAIKSAPPVYCPKCEQPSVAEADRCQACGWPLT